MHMSLSGGTGIWWRWGRLLMCGLAVVYVIAPLIIVVILSFSSAPFLTFPPPGLSLQWYESLFGNPVWYGSLLTSIKILVPTAILATAIGTAAAFGMSRSEFRGKSIIAGLIMSPIIVPVIITAVGMFGAFRSLGLFGTLAGLIAAHTVLTVPFVFATVSGALSVIDQRLEGAAATLGATPWVSFRRVTLPLILPGILSGLLFAVVISFDELVVSMFISTPAVRPITVQMWSNVRGAVDPTIAAVASILLLFCLSALVAQFMIDRGGDRRVDR